MYIAAHVPWTDAAITVDGLGTTADTAITGLGIENDQILLNHAKNCIECYDHFTVTCMVKTKYAAMHLIADGQWKIRSSEIACTVSLFGVKQI